MHDFALTRRDVVKGGAAAAAMLAADSAVAQAAATVSGIVFEDRSGSGRRQSGDPGVAGVMVSNGREVVKTDENGRYTLPVEDESVIFVIKPTGYAVPLEPDTNLPRFHYV